MFLFIGEVLFEFVSFGLGLLQERFVGFHLIPIGLNAKGGVVMLLEVAPPVYRGDEAPLKFIAEVRMFHDVFSGVSVKLVVLGPSALAHPPESVHVGGTVVFNASLRNLHETCNDLLASVGLDLHAMAVEAVVCEKVAGFVGVVASCLGKDKVFAELPVPVYLFGILVLHAHGVCEAQLDASGYVSPSNLAMAFPYGIVDIIGLGINDAVHVVT